MRPGFDAVKTKQLLIDWIRTRFEENGKNCYVAEKIAAMHKNFAFKRRNIPDPFSS